MFKRVNFSIHKNPVWIAVNSFWEFWFYFLLFRYGEVLYNITYDKVCSYKVERTCVPREERVCISVPQTICDLEVGYTCENTPTEQKVR